MKAASILGRLFAVFALLGSTSAADKVKSLDVSGFPFFSSAKRGNVPQFSPGLTAALELTDAQKQQIIAAREEAFNDEAVKSTRYSKNDPNVTEAQRAQAKAATAAAETRLREKLATILTADQKALIEKINAIYAATNEELSIVYETKFVSSKGDDALQQRLREEKARDFEERFQQNLAGILTASQKDAMTRAAAEERLRLAQAGEKKKVK